MTDIPPELIEESIEVFWALGWLFLLAAILGMINGMWVFANRIEKQCPLVGTQIKFSIMISGIIGIFIGLILNT